MATPTFTSTALPPEDTHIKVMVYAVAGAGKTRLCATAPGPLILSAEGGMLSLRDHNIPVVVIDSVQTLIDVNAWCYQSTEAGQFQTICLDSISEIAETILANAKAKAKDPRQAYGELIDKMMDIIRSFRDLPRHHVYMSCKLGRDNDPLTGAMLYGPAMPGKRLSAEIAYFFDEVFKLDKGTTIDGTHYDYLLTQGDQQSIAKDRSGALLPHEYPDLNNIFNKIRGVAPA
jgi:hypothetical protein